VVEHLVEDQVEVEDRVTTVVNLDTCRGIVPRSVQLVHFGQSSGGGGSRGACYQCGKEGHLSRDCTERGDGGSSRRPDDRKCYNCGEGGHLSRDCPDAGSRRTGGGGGGGGGNECFTCGGTDHIQRNCPKKAAGGGGSNGASNMRCYNCNEMGHMSRDCPVEG